MPEVGKIQVKDLDALWLSYQKERNPETREKLVNHYLPLVKLVAGRIAMGLPQYVEREELISNGYFGLLEALERFDPQRGFKFETYAVVRIRGAILDAIRSQDWIPVSVRQKARNYTQVIAELEQQLGRSASDGEIAAAMNMSQQEFSQFIGQLQATTVMPLEDYTHSDTLADSAESPSEQAEIGEVKNTLIQAINKLPEKEKIVVSLYYYEGMTLKEISLILKLSEARISQLHTKAVFRLRGALARIKSSLL
ncbi:MAG: FliA/WhiG family RNA polymerase sigma factor [Veillonellaceae bacterium]|nr:FliA/WhiG family RNA polymerase sigma factor [Veillonellaceae bacterium]